MSEFSHVDSTGRARMVDVSAKSETTRIAVADGQLRTTPEVVALVRADNLPKADVLATARIAGIAGAKKTSELIPLCHQLALSSVRVEFDFTDEAIMIEATAKTNGPTGVEMEALTAVAVAGLTLHDMVKAVDPAATLNGVELRTKEGGKRGRWTRPTGPDRTTTSTTPEAATSAATERTDEHPSNSAVVLVASTGVANGTRTDATGPRLTEWLTGLGLHVRGPLVYADADISAGLAEALRYKPALVVTTGGTGATPNDRTPEATAAILDRELPGVAEEIRRRGAENFPKAVLSRGVAGLSGQSVVVNLPGSPGGVKDGIAMLEPLLEHLLAQAAGGSDHDNA